MSGAIRGSMNSITHALVTDDTAAMIAWPDGNDKVRSGAVGCVGHCMSGCYITTVAARFPHRMTAAGSRIWCQYRNRQARRAASFPAGGEGGSRLTPLPNTSVPAHVIPELGAALGKTDGPRRSRSLREAPSRRVVEVSASRGGRCTTRVRRNRPGMTFLIFGSGGRFRARGFSRGRAAAGRLPRVVSGLDWAAAVGSWEELGLRGGGRFGERLRRGKGGWLRGSLAGDGACCEWPGAGRLPRIRWLASGAAAVGERPGLGGSGSLVSGLG